MFSSLKIRSGKGFCDGEMFWEGESGGFYFLICVYVQQSSLATSSVITYQGLSRPFQGFQTFV